MDVFLFIFETFYFKYTKNWYVFKVNLFHIKGFNEVKIKLVKTKVYKPLADIFLNNLFF